MTKRIQVAIIGMISALYLINPGFGIFEILPDAIPFVGNLDEASAALLLISSLSYFGIDLKSIFRNFFKREKQ